MCETAQTVVQGGVKLDSENGTRPPITPMQLRSRHIGGPIDADRMSDWIAKLGHELRNPVGRVSVCAVNCRQGYCKDFGNLGPGEFDHHVIKPIDLCRLSALIAEAG